MRGALCDRKDLTPSDRLAREGAARAIAQRVWAWINGDSGADAAPEKAQLEAFETARASVLELLGAAPPRETSGCPACPARCRMLPFVAGYAPQLHPKIAVLLNAPPGKTGDLGAVEGLVEGAVPLLTSRADDATLHRDYLYCLLATSTPGGAATPRRDAMLDGLRAAPSDPNEGAPHGR